MKNFRIVTMSMVLLSLATDTQAMFNFEKKEQPYRLKPRFTEEETRNRLCALYPKEVVANDEWITKHPTETFETITDVPEFATYEACALTSARNKVDDLKKVLKNTQKSISGWQKVAGLGSSYFMTNYRLSLPAYTPNSKKMVETMADHYGQSPQWDQTHENHYRFSPDPNRWGNRYQQFKNQPQAELKNSIYIDHVQFKDAVKMQLEGQELVFQAQKENRRWIAQGTVTLAAVAAATGTGLYLWAHKK
jgi:hypothetical protein